MLFLEVCSSYSDRLRFVGTMRALLSLSGESAPHPLLKDKPISEPADLDWTAEAHFRSISTSGVARTRKGF